MSTDWDAVEAALHAWTVAGSGLTAQQVVWTQQPDAARPPEPAVMMKWYVYDTIGTPWVDTVENPLVIDGVVVTEVNGNDLTAEAHGLSSGDGPVELANPPSPCVEDTDYWIIRIDDDTLQLAETFVHTGGNVVGNPITPITLTSTDTPTISSTADTLRAGEEVLQVVRGSMRIGLQLFCHTSTGIGMDAAMAILRRVVDRAWLPSQQTILSDAGIGLTGTERVRPLLGDKDAVMFQPRAWVDIQMTMSFEESEGVGIIESVEITDLSTGIVTVITPTTVTTGTPFAAFSADITLNRAEFTDLSSALSGIVSWSWDFGDDQQSTSENPTHLYADTGTYTVSLTVTTSDGDSSTTSAPVTITGEAVSLIAMRYTATGGESDFMATLPTTMATDAYQVVGSCAGVAAIVIIDCPDLLAGDRSTTQFRVITSAPLTAGDQLDFVIT